MREITLRLTKAEAEALASAAGEVMLAPDLVEQMFRHPAERRVAYRAFDKFNAARHAKGRTDPIEALERFVYWAQEYNKCCEVSEIPAQLLRYAQKALKDFGIEG
jgi:hypothetical protein